MSAEAVLRVFFIAQGSLPELPEQGTIRVLALFFRFLACDQGSGSPAIEPAGGTTVHATVATTGAPSSLM